MAGTRSTIMIAGKMRKTSGKRSLIGIFCAFSSATARRRLRISVARFRMVLAIETPSFSPWVSERTNMRMFGCLPADRDW